MTLARDVIRGFLSARRQPTPICSPCLSRLTGLSSVRMAEGWRDLAELSADYHVDRGRCDDCRETGDVLSRAEL